MIVGGAIVAGGAYAGYLVWQQKRDLEQLLFEALLSNSERPLTGEEKETRCARSACPRLACRPASRRARRLRNHFEDTQRECEAALGRELPRVLEQLSQLLDMHAIRSQLQGPGATPEMWRNFTLTAFSRPVAAVYAFALLLLGLRVRLNIIARHYLAESTDTSATELNRLTKLRFLTVQRLCEEGFEPLVQAVRPPSYSRVRRVARVAAPG